MVDYDRLSREELVERLRALENDVSDRTQVTDPRSVSEEQYRTLFNTMVEEVHVWELVRDDAGRILTWRLVDLNPAGERSWGMARASVVGKTADEIFTTATEHFMPIVTRIFETGQPYSWETYFQDIDQHMRMTSVPFGEYFFTTGFDVTELKKNSARQEKLSMMARMATEASEIGVWELDLDTGRLTWNEQMSRIFGTDPKSLSHTASDWSDRLHPDDRDEMVAKLQTCIETGEKFVGNFRIVTPSGGTRVIKARSEILKSESSGTPVLIGTNIDITAQEDLINELQVSKELANASNAAKSEFLASMSHELRTPLNAVIGYSELLKLMAADRLTEKDQEYLDDILESGQHLLSLINDVLDLSQIEAGSVEIDEEDISITDIFDHVETFVLPLASRKGLSIERQPMPPCLPRVCSDRMRLSQILINLLTNAIKYSPDGGRITLAAAIPSRHRVRLSVTDAGCGIAPDDQSVIFDPFTRLHNDSMTPAEGVGIGLAVSKKLADRLGGVIGVDSDVGSGSTFWLDFPCEPGGTTCDESCGKTSRPLMPADPA